MCKRDDRDYKTRKLSASDSGRGIKVAATATPGTVIHTALNTVAANEWDQVYLSAVNTSASVVKLTIEWGGTTNPDDQIEMTIQPEAGLVVIMDGLILQNGKEIRAFAATANVIVIHGLVHRYQETR